MIAFRDFSFQYAAQTEPTLRAINLRIEKGEKVLITGPSGCGKSTLIHCINGLIPHAFKGVSSGKLEIAGLDGASLDIFGFSRIVGTVLQDCDGQFVSLTAAEDIAFAAENNRVSVEEMKRRVPQAAEMVQIAHRLGASPHDLSGGQKQRVSMAGILMMESEVLLFDEPLANLDPAAGKQAIEIIDELHEKTGKTIIIVEHRLEDVLHRHVDRIVLMREGRVEAALPPSEMLASDLLQKAGVREPLYLSALKYAGLSPAASDHPEDLGRLSFDSAVLRSWNAGDEERERLPVESPLLEARNLFFSYGGGGRPATLENVSFTIMKGERCALVGRNGSGKSTLAKLITGFLRPDSGEMRFNGEELAGLSIKERADRIGFVLQNPNQMISFPMIYDEAAFALRNRGIGEAETRERVHEALLVCGLYPFRNWPVSALSYGQKKRLTIAAILVTGLRFLILDEPTAGQDWRHYTAIMTFLEKLRREAGLTFLLITHDMHLLLEYTDRALVLSAEAGSPGRLLAFDEPAVILSDDALIEAASLKRTSLYDLALRAGIASPLSFIRRFISHEWKRQGGGDNLGRGL